MDFRAVLERVIQGFNRLDISYALIGGLALGVHGIPRGTVDIDFLVKREDMGKVDIIMKELGYECKYSTENVSQYVSPLRIFGEVDFLHAFRSASLQMLKRAETRKVFNETVSIKVLKVEDLIGLKIQAMANDESRLSGDLADIDSLMAANRDIDWGLVEEYFSLFGFDEVFEELKGRYKR